MAYTLSYRQDRAFSDTFDIYRPVKRDSAGKKFQGMAYVLSAAGVRGRVTPKPEAAMPTQFGRTNQDQIDTTDVLRLHMDEECDDGYRVQVKTPGHPEYGTWYSVNGGPQVRSWRARENSFYMARSLRPDIEE